MPRHPFMPRHSPVAVARARIVAALALVLAAPGRSPAPCAAAEGPTMEARILLGGHARLGSWVAISVHLKNDGPAVCGELRLAGGTQGQTRFGKAVELPTQSDQVHVLYAQPPAFGSELTVGTLVDGEQDDRVDQATFTPTTRTSSSWVMKVASPVLSPSTRVTDREPPNAGGSLSVTLVDGDKTIATAKPTSSPTTSCVASWAVKVGLAVAIVLSPSTR